MSNLAGDNADYLITQPNARKTGSRQDQRMSIMAEGRSNEDMADLAAGYSCIELTTQMSR